MISQNTKITIQDIARKASVSPSTVSRVISGNARVNDDKRQAVLAAIEELDYRPNVFAQSLASGQSMTIGVMTQNFGTAFYDGILTGILSTLEPTSYSPIFGDGRWQKKVEKRAIQTLIDRKVDGLIIVGGLAQNEEISSIAQQVPLVMVGRLVGEGVPELRSQCLYVNNQQAAYEATRYLLEMGHRRIAHVTAAKYFGSLIPDIYQRYQGYVQALAEYEIEPDPDLIVEGDLSRQSGLIALDTLVGRQRPFTAIFAANDQMAIGLRLGLHRRGFRVPEDISLIGFDDEPVTPYLTPPLTTVHQPSIELGKAAGEAILSLIKGEPNLYGVFPAKLVIRESVARLR